MARKKVIYVQFEQIRMLDDSDDLSDGEFRFYFFVNDKLVTGEPVTIDIPFIGKKTVIPNHIVRVMGTGQTTNINRTGYAEGVNAVKISVSGIEDDDDPDFLPTLDKKGTGVPHKPFGTGENSVAEWATGNITVSTPNPSTDKAVLTSFELDANGHKKDIDVRFKVKGQVVVTFSG